MVKYEMAEQVGNPLNFHFSYLHQCGNDFQSQITLMRY